jgi:hypothetical protein
MIDYPRIFIPKYSWGRKGGMANDHQNLLGKAQNSLDTKTKCKVFPSSSLF